MDAENLKKLADLKRRMTPSEVAIKVKKKTKPKKQRSRSFKKSTTSAEDPASAGKQHPKPDQPKPKRTDWIKARCTICRTEFAYLPEWRPVPVLCSGCRNERKRFAAGRRGGARNERQSAFTNTFTSMSIVPGGAPGGGRKR